MKLKHSIASLLMIGAISCSAVAAENSDNLTIKVGNFSNQSCQVTLNESGRIPYYGSEQSHQLDAGVSQEFSYTPYKYAILSDVVVNGTIDCGDNNIAKFKVSHDISLSWARVRTLNHKIVSQFNNESGIELLGAADDSSVNIRVAAK